MLKAVIISLVKWYLSFFGDNSHDHTQAVKLITTDGQGQRRGEQRTSKKGTRGQAEKLVSGISPEADKADEFKRHQETRQRQEVKRMTWEEMKANMRAYEDIRAVMT